MSRKTEKKRRMSAGRILDTGMTYLILFAVAFVFFFPCLWLILASFSKSGTIYSFDGFFPAGYSLASFKRLFTDTALYNLSALVCQYTFCGGRQLHPRHVSGDPDCLYHVAFYVCGAQTDDEDYDGAWNVSFLYGNDCGVPSDDAV